MSLSKEMTRVGAVLEVKRITKSGLPAAMGGGVTAHLSLYTGQIGSLVCEHLFAPTRLTVVKAPRKTAGMNMCRVRTEDGREGEAYWCELRASCIHIEPAKNRAQG